MKKTAKYMALALCLAGRLSEAAELKPLPGGWEMIGAAKSKFEAGLDPSVTRSGKPTGHLRSKNLPLDASSRGVLAQTFRADEYRGKRLRYAAQLKFKSVAYQVGLWMWVIGPNNNILTSDFMDDAGRLLKGDSDWRGVEIVLDVPKNAQRIVYGLRLSGPGKAWLSDTKIEPAGPDAQVTDPLAREDDLPLEPVNLF
ncbi:MAG: hypothetical protein A3G41_01955 [Elusimicrobia bacterium RIFCSPLOWO2_12_FULL_59_9]|nr:MAG: hypothetical protein A3G41_01955 [Elusimicrobia bacterium RIFCSPLOWO2_12_FULL_59_9]